MFRRLSAAVAAFGFFLISAAHAQNLDSEYKAWSVFTLDQDGKKLCYITSSPTGKTGNYKRRGDPYYLVTYRGNDVSEISVSSGYPYKKDSTVQLVFDGKTRYDLFTSPETPKISWARDANEDKKIIRNMMKGTKVTARGTSRLGSYSLDTYSLFGFTKAYKRMVALCDSK